MVFKTEDEARAYVDKSNALWNWPFGLSITPTDNGPEWCKVGFKVAVVDENGNNI